MRRRRRLWGRIAESFGVSFVLLVVFMGTAAMAQLRNVDQGRGGTTTAQVWLVKICDQNGANCGTVAIPVTMTGTMTVTGTVQSNAGTGTVNVTCISGCGGAATFSDASAFSFGTTPIGNIGAVVDDVATNTVAENSAALPRMSVNRVLFLDLKNTQANATNLNVTATGTVTVTSGTIGQITMPALTFTSGTIGNTVTISPTTFTAAQGAASATGWPVTESGAWNVTASLAAGSNTIGAVNAGTGTFNTTFATGTLTGAIPAGTNSIGAITNTGFTANAGTGTFGVDLAKVLGAALSTANPVTGGGRGSTTVPTAVADAAVVAQRYSKFGDTITQLAPIDLVGFGTTSVTAVTAAQILAASGVGVKWAITSIMACNLSGVVATVMNFTDSSGTLFSFPWTQTATTAGESRCYMQQFPTPYLSAANSTISVALTVSDATGVRANITAYKTGT